MKGRAGERRSVWGQLRGRKGRHGMGGIVGREIKVAEVEEWRRRPSVWVKAWEREESGAGVGTGH